MAITPPNSVPPVQPSPRPPFRSFSSSSYMATTMLPGFYVGSDADISARDVPGDGSIAFFPCKDLSHIVIKQWSGNTLESMVYVPLGSQQAQQVQQSQSPLPAPPPPSAQKANNDQPQQPEPSSKRDPVMDELLASFNRMNEGVANAFGQFGEVLTAMQKNLDKLNGHFLDVDETAMG